MGPSGFGRGPFWGPEARLAVRAVAKRPVRGLTTPAECHSPLVGRQRKLTPLMINHPKPGRVGALRWR